MMLYGAELLSLLLTAEVDAGREAGRGVLPCQGGRAEHSLPTRAAGHPRRGAPAASHRYVDLDPGVA